MLHGLQRFHLLNQCCKYKLFFSILLYLFGDKKDLDGSIQSLSELSIIKMNFNVASGEEKHFKSNIYNYISK